MHKKKRNQKTPFSYSISFQGKISSILQISNDKIKSNEKIQQGTR